MKKTRMGKWGWKTWFYLCLLGNTVDVATTIWCNRLAGGDTSAETSPGISILAHYIGFVPAMVFLKVSILAGLAIYCVRSKNGPDGGRDMLILVTIGILLCALNNLGCFWFY